MFSEGQLDWAIVLALLNAAVVMPVVNSLTQRCVFRPLGKLVLGVRDPKKTDDGGEADMKAVVKFEESGWKCLAYGAISCVSGYALLGKPFWSDTTALWTGCAATPCPAAPAEIRAAYAFDMGYYTYAIPYALLYETKRKDMAAMIIHHVLTVTLIAYSYATGFTKVGVVIMFIHDICDVPLELAKMARYAKHEALTNTLFALFTGLWIYMRIYIYPFRVLRSVLFEARPILSKFEDVQEWPHYYVFSAMLVALGLLHVNWTVVILKILYKALFKGNGIKDDREADEDDD